MSIKTNVMFKPMIICIALFWLLSCTSDDENIMNIPDQPDSTDASTHNDNGNKAEVSFLALGDSYTIGQSVAVKDRWPLQLQAMVNDGDYSFILDDPKIIARTGWTTSELESGIEAEKPGENYDFVSLLIGVNDQYRGYSVEGYGPKFEELLEMAISFAGNKKDHVIVISIPDYGYTPFGETNRRQISEGIDAYNAVNKRITLEYGIRYYNITEISRKGLDQPSLVASDGLHPSGKQYAEWIKLILSDPDFEEIFDQ